MQVFTRFSIAKVLLFALFLWFLSNDTSNCKVRVSKMGHFEEMTIGDNSCIIIADFLTRTEIRVKKSAIIM